MISKVKHLSRIRAPFYTVLFAWLALQSLNFIHADEIDHHDQTAHDCIICTHSFLDGELNSSPDHMVSERFELHETPILARTYSLPTGLLTLSVNSRAPPFL
jgi:hypothetical protein